MCYARRDHSLPISPSPMIKPVPASIRARVGNKLGTVLATSAPCGHNAETPRWRRASLGFADFKYHRNLFPMRRRWQTLRTQNPVHGRGCRFKSHLRYFKLTAADSRGSTIGQEIGSQAFRRSDWPGPDDRNPAMRSEYRRAPPLGDAGVRSDVDCESKRHALARRRGPE